MKEEVLRLRQEELGDRHPHTLTAMGSLATSLEEEEDQPTIFHCASARVLFDAPPDEEVFLSVRMLGRVAGGGALKARGITPPPRSKVTQVAAAGSVSLPFARRTEAGASPSKPRPKASQPSPPPQRPHTTTYFPTVLAPSSVSASPSAPPWSAPKTKKKQNILSIVDSFRRPAARSIPSFCRRNPVPHEGGEAWKEV